MKFREFLRKFKAALGVSLFVFLLGSVSNSKLVIPYFEGEPWNSIPPQHHLFLYFDWNNNVGSYRSTPVTDEERRPRNVYFYEVPESSLRSLGIYQIESQFTKGDSALQNLVTGIDREGNKYYRIYTLDPTQKCFDPFQKNGFWVHHGLRGVKLQSRASYFIWDPSHLEQEPFVVKFSNSYDSNEIGYSFYAIENSQYTEQSLRNQQDPKIGYLPEVAAAGWQGITPYSFVIRSLKAVGYKPKEGEVLAPVHGILGAPEFLRQLAQASQMTERRWIFDEYVEKYAEFLAQMHYVHGIHPESHTQNLNMYVNFETGKIGAFVHKDSSHDVIDVNARLASRRGTDPVVLPGQRILNLYGKTNWKNGYSFNAGALFASVSVKGLLDVLTGVYDQIEGSKKFLDSYIKYTEGITGLKIPITGELKKAYDRLNGPADQIRGFSYLVHGDLPIILGQAVEHIHGEVTTRSKAFLNRGIRKFTRQAAFDEVKYKIEEHKYVQLAKDVPSVTDQYYFDGEKIVVRKRFTGRIIGYAYDVDEAAMAARAYRPPSTVCPALLMDF